MEIKKINEIYKVNVPVPAILCKCDLCGREFKRPYRECRFKDNEGNHVFLSIRGPNLEKLSGNASSYCNLECSHKADSQRSVERRKKWEEEIKRSKEKDAKRKRDKRAQDRLKLPDNTCVHCGKSFRPVRKDAKFCSNACKQKDYRDRKNNQ